VIAGGRVPPHDVVVTNPPYSADHVGKLLDFASSNGKPFLLCMPKYCSEASYYTSRVWPAEGGGAPAFLCPKLRYHYWTPDGLRDAETPSLSPPPAAAAAAAAGGGKADEMAAGKGKGGGKSAARSARSRSGGRSGSTASGHHSQVCGARTSPFVSFWYVNASPVVGKEQLREWWAAEQARCPPASEADECVFCHSLDDIPSEEWAGGGGRY
jgi:hypothetical protein